MEGSRFALGLEQLSKIDGEAGHRVIESLQASRMLLPSGKPKLYGIRKAALVCSVI